MRINSASLHQLRKIFAGNFKANGRIQQGGMDYIFRPKGTAFGIELRPLAKFRRAHSD